MMQRAIRYGITAGLVLVAAAIPCSAANAATGQCVPGAAEATCGVLDDCSVIGATYMTLPPADALSFYRTCLFTDHRYELVSASGGVAARERRSPLPAIYKSTYWPLYCYSVRRAGQRDPSICERGSSSGTSRTHRARRHSTRRSSPNFTG